MTLFGLRPVRESGAELCVQSSLHRCIAAFLIQRQRGLEKADFGLINLDEPGCAVKGQRGSGKSRAVRGLLRQLARFGERGAAFAEVAAAYPSFAERE
jgi:hypothetical protein